MVRVVILVLPKDLFATVLRQGVENGFLELFIDISESFLFSLEAHEDGFFLMIVKELGVLVQDMVE